jgi:hypothetical protein
MYVARYNPKGALRTNFGPNGDGLFRGVPIRPDAKIVTVGTAPTGTTRDPIDSALIVRHLGDFLSS